MKTQRGMAATNDVAASRRGGTKRRLQTDLRFIEAQLQHQRNLRRKTRFARMILLVCCLFGTAKLASADEVYVAPNGSDEADGTLQAPCRTVAQAVKLIGSGGGTVWMRGGVYAETQTVTGKFDEATPLHICAYQQERPIIRNAKELPANFVAEEGCYSIDLDDSVAGLFQDIGNNPLIQTPFQSCPDKAKVAATNPAFAWDKKTLKLHVNLERKGDDPNAHKMTASFLAAGLRIVGAQNVVIEGIEVECAGDAAFSIAAGKDIVLRRCRAWDSARLALSVDQSSDVQMENCAFARSLNAVQISASSNVALTHCTIALTRAHGMIIGKDCHGLRVTNNVFHAGGVSGAIYYFIAPAADSVFDFNLLHPCHEGKGDFYANDAARSQPALTDFAAYQKETGREKNSVNAEPKFISLEVGKENLGLASGSPGLGKAMKGGNCGISQEPLSLETRTP